MNSHLFHGAPTEIECDDDDSRPRLGLRSVDVGVSPGETVKCIFTNESKAPGGGGGCPADTVFNPDTGLCEADPSCPSIAPFNPDKDRCEDGTPEPAVCPVTGLPPVDGLCTSDSSCLDGNLQNTVTDVCEYGPPGPGMCPEGFDPVGDVCRMNPCPISEPLNFALDLCVPLIGTGEPCAPGTIEVSPGICGYEPPCPADAPYDEDLNGCIKDPIPGECFPGSTLNSGTGLCESDISCDLGDPYDWDDSLDVCTADVPPAGQCPDELMLDETDNICIAQPSCPAGTSLNFETNLCQSIRGCEDLPPTIVGTEGDDPIDGTRDNDVIDALGGNDQVKAKKGDDIVRGGTGDDTLNGNSGNDCLSGADDNDILNGGRGDDLLLAGSGDDVLSGGRGNDVLFGGEGINDLRGGRGNDVCHADANDIVRRICEIVIPI